MALRIASIRHRRWAGETLYKQQKHDLGRAWSSYSFLRQFMNGATWTFANCHSLWRIQQQHEYDLRPDEHRIGLKRSCNDYTEDMGYWIQSQLKD